MTDRRGCASSGTAPNPTLAADARDAIGGERALRRMIAFLRSTPLHPQWFACRGECARLAVLGTEIRGHVLDIGCADQKPRRYLSTECIYIGLDHYLTASEWYGTRPQVYGDAAALPFPPSSFDWVLLLDVLEHLPDPQRTIGEIKRVLKSGGRLVLQVPFLYPLHDAPLDFQRWTLHGLRTLGQRFELSVTKEECLSNPLQSAALLANLAFSKVVLRWLQRRNPLGLLVVLLPPFVVVANLLAWLLSRFVPNDDFMPHGFSLILQKR